MDVPERIQLRRTAGSRLPAGAMSVARPTRWGNPWSEEWAIEYGRAANRTEAREVIVRMHRDWLLETDPSLPDVVFGSHGRRYDRRLVMELLPGLAGRDLACWCWPGDQCHADTLIELANKDGSGG